MNKIGKYEIRDELGRGGFGVVYRAWDAAADRSVALKVMGKERVGDAEMVARFRREAEIAASIRHPNIVEVYELGDDQGSPYIAMEILDGTDLFDRLRLGVPMSQDERIGIVVQVAAGLEAAHRRGIVHRDIKPSNVRITSRGQAKIMDFGLAYLPSSTLTRTGAVIGTPAYMPPEQIRGMSTDRRCDIYSLGVMFYELICRQRPFRAPTIHALVFKILRDEPPRPSAVAEVADWLEPILVRCIAKRPEARYQSCRELVAGLKVAIPPDSPVAVASASLTQSDLSGDDVDGPQATDPLIGQLAGGRFRLERHLGNDHFGDLYLVRDPRGGDELVVRLAHATLADQPGFVTRFRHTVTQLAEMVHPFLVEVLDHGDLDGRPYAITPYLAGGNLAGRLEASPPATAASLADWLPTIAEALDFAHAAGLVHRDVSPRSIAFDRRGRAFLADLGIASSLTSDWAHFLLSGAAGTSGYMAPEAATDPDPHKASDQYSLAAVAYHLLTGQLPHQGATVGALLVQKATVAPRPVSELAPTVSKGVASAILRALKPAPGDRFESCSAFASAILDASGEGPDHLASDTARPLPILFRRLRGHDVGEPKPGEVWLRPRSLDERQRRDLASLVLDIGLEGLDRGRGPITCLVVSSEPTLDDMLAATFAGQLARNRKLPEAAPLYASYAALVREGFEPAAVPLTLSIEGIFLAALNDGDTDLTQPPAAERMATRWREMATVLLAAMADGKDPFKVALFEETTAFRRERTFLARDYLTYRQDVAAGESWRLTLIAGETSARAGLYLSKPKSLLFKSWSRRDSDAPAGGAYSFLAIHWGQGKWVLSTDPLERVPLDGLARELQAAELGRDSERAERDPWFDGAPFGHTLIAAPHGGSAMESGAVLDIVRRWTHAEPIDRPSLPAVSAGQ